jgi:NADH-quinone oxidoreductase subunit N
MSFQLPVLDWELFLTTLPMLLVALGSLDFLLLGVFFPRAPKPLMIALTVFLLALALVATAFVPIEDAKNLLSGGVLGERLAVFGQITLLGIALFTVLKFAGTWLSDRFFRGEAVSLFLMTLLGMMVLVAADDLLTIFVGLELSAIGLYALIGYLYPTNKSVEAAVKYLVLGSFAAAFLLFGMALMYGVTGTLRISETVLRLRFYADHPWMTVGSLFFLTGMAFKMALVPFHLWAPDAYEGAPTGITAFMVTSVKVMVLIVLLRLFADGMAPMFFVWMPAMVFLAIVSMIVGNVMALVQVDLKRMLAYSSISHSGYMAVALATIGAVSGRLPVDAVLFYIVSYVIMSVGAFGVLMWLEREELESLTMEHVAGLASRHPLAAFALSVFMLGFAGMPPMVGFMAKFFVFHAALSGNLLWLVLVGALGSTISLGYYLRVIVRMYMTPANTQFKQPVLRPSRLMAVVVGLSLVLTVLLGSVGTRASMRMVHRAASQVISG